VVYLSFKSKSLKLKFVSGLGSNKVNNFLYENICTFASVMVSLVKKNLPA